MKYIIQDREAGNVIEEVATFDEAEEIVTDYERQDRYQGCYEPDFYEIKAVCEKCGKMYDIEDDFCPECEEL